MKDSLIIYTAYQDKFKILTDEQLGRLLRYMIDYQITGEVPEIEDAVVALSFDVVKVDMDRNNEKYQKVVHRNQENGKKGGRPKTETQDNPKNPVGYSETQPNPKEPKKADNDKDNDNDNDNVTFKKSNKNNKGWHVSDGTLEAWIEDFIRHRKAMKKPMTNKAVELFIIRLEKLCPGNIGGQIELIKTAIERGWQTVYPDDNKKVTPIQRDNSDKLKELERRYMADVD